MAQQVARHPDKRDWFAEVRAGGVLRTAIALGLTGDSRNGLSPCPACGAVKRHPRRGDKRGALGLGHEGAGWHCFECEKKGDAVTLAAWRLTGAELGRGDPRWAQVREGCAGLGLCDPAPGSTVKRPKLAPLPQAVATMSAKALPPAAEVAALWSACGPVTTDTEVAACLESLKIDPAIVALLDNARALPKSYAWPSWWPAGWAAAWRLMVPAFGPRGDMASLHARAIRGDAEPKTRWPRDCASGGLLMADRWGAEFLRGTFKPDKVIVAEGLTDMLAASDWCDREGRPYAVLSITSGGATAFAQIAWPDGLPCIVATDPDEAGEVYAKKIRAALPARVAVSRMKFPRGIK